MMRWLLLAAFLIFRFDAAHADEGVELGQSTLGNIFVEGDRVAIPVRTEGDRVQWRVTDFFGTEIASASAAVTGGAVTIEPAIGDLGYFSLQVTATRGGASIGQAQTALAIVPSPAPAGGASPFGVMTHFAKGWDTAIVPLIEKSGIRYVRDEQPWKQIEKDNGHYDFPASLDSYMAALAQHHIDPLTVLAFANPLYDEGKTPYSDAGRAGYAAYAGAVVQHYKSGLRAVEIWNEYNGSFCDGPCTSDRPAYYASMLKDAYKAAKAADPNVLVAGGAAVPIPLDYFRRLFDDGGLAAMDAVVIHPYRKDPEGVEQEIGALNELMARYGKPKPVWATEYGDLADMHKNRDDEARYLVRMTVLLLSAHVERMYWYLMQDYQEFTGMGLLRGENDPLGRDTPTPAYAAYATLIHQLDGLSFVRREPSDPRTRIYLFANGGREVRVAWSALPGASLDVASNDPVELVTMMGGKKVVSPQGGKISVPLDGNPIYVIGKAAPVAGPASDQVTASTLDDFSMTQGMKGWSYGAILRANTPMVIGTSVAEPLEPLQPNPAGDAWIRSDSPALKIKAGMMHPGRSHAEAVFAVRRWSSPISGAVRVTGTVQAGEKNSAGITFALVVDGRAAYVAELGGAGGTTRADFDLKLAVNKSSTIDFAVGPGRSGGIDFDATQLSAFIGPAPAGP